MSKRTGRRAKKGCAGTFALPFSSWSRGLPGKLGRSNDEDAIERRLMSIDKRGVAPAVIRVIEKLDAASVSGTFGENMRSLVNESLREVENLNASDEDKFVLRRKLRSFLK